MEHTLQTMHPVNYLDAIGENIADVGGTSSDLFETMCITLATSVILGAKAHDVPYFGTSLPFNIISTGTFACSIVSYYVWVKNNHTPSRIRMHLRLNLLFVMIFVLLGVSMACYWQHVVWRTISYERMVNYIVITALGLLAPEVCATLCEFFTSVGCPPVAWIAQNADLGMIQVILQGLGQGFVSSGVPSVINIIVQIFAFTWEGFYGLVLLACASQACTGWQATLASYGAVANNANRMVHLTTINEMAHHRSNVCAMIGTTTSHTGKCVAGQNAFFATTALLGALLADKYTKLGLNFQLTVSQELSEFTRAGMLAGIIFTMLFIANTLTSCIKMAKQLVKFCKDNPAVLPRTDKVFPATHIIPLKNLVAWSSVASFQLTFSPLVNTLAAPLVIGQLFGFKGLLMLVSGGNSVCFSLNMFLINSGQAWDAARKYVLFGMLKDEEGVTIGAENEVYETLGIGEQVGGPLEDLAGPGLNNFIKFVAVVSFVTSGIYDLTPEKTWPFGMLQVVLNGMSVSFFKFGLAWTIKKVEEFFKRRRQAIEEEEGTAMLREIEAREQKIQDKLVSAGLGGPGDDDFAFTTS
jgi:Na+/H+-translocating membrane pyrophosphatase